MAERAEVDFEPVGRRVECALGSTLLEAAQQAGVMLTAVCGGEGSCGRCMVRVPPSAPPPQSGGHALSDSPLESRGRPREGESGGVSAPTLTEKAELAPDDLARGVRLACQTTVHGSVRVYIPPESLAAAQRTQVESDLVETELEPAVFAVDVSLDPPTLDDLRADATRLASALTPRPPLPTLGEGELVYDTFALRQLPNDLRAWGWQARAVLRGPQSCHSEAQRASAFARSAEESRRLVQVSGIGYEVIAVRPIGHRLLGLAVDIGTTKLAAYLLDLETGQTLGASGAMNPQIAYGEDVMARIAYVMHVEGGKGERGKVLQGAVADAINGMAASLCAQAGAQVADIADAVIVGNTAMHHLFAGLPVSQLGVAPYVAATRDPLDLKARDVGLSLAPGAYVHLLPNIAGFVGADHVAMLLSSGMGNIGMRISTDERGLGKISVDPHAVASASEIKNVALGMDIGTNTEICLRARGKLWACSTASGPAFEGAHIQHGMRAAPGAIERVAIDGDHVHIKTVNDAPPVGLCGSGILDLIAQLRRADVLDARGAFRPHPRVRGDKFIVVPGESNDGREITLSRADISEIQLAKAAIRAGARILLRQAGLAEADVDQVIIAGAFGTYLDVQSGMDIGLFPRLDRHQFKQIGNAAGAGARMALLSMRERERAVQIACRVGYVELTAVPDFQREFAGALRLGGRD